MADYPKAGDSPGVDYLSVADAVVTGNLDQVIDGSKTFLNKVYALGGVEGSTEGLSGYSGSNAQTSGYSGYSGSGVSGYSGSGVSG